MPVYQKTLLHPQVTISGLKISEQAEETLREQVKADYPYPGEESSPEFDAAYADALKTMRQSASSATQTDIFMAMDELIEADWPEGMGVLSVQVISKQGPDEETASALTPEEQFSVSASLDLETISEAINDQEEVAGKVIEMLKEKLQGRLESGSSQGYLNLSGAETEISLG